MIMIMGGSHGHGGHLACGNSKPYVYHPIHVEMVNVTCIYGDADGWGIIILVTTLTLLMVIQ